MLQALDAQTYPDLEIIVCNGDSSDGTLHRHLLVPLETSGRRFAQKGLESGKILHLHNAAFMVWTMEEVKRYKL